MTWNQKRIVGGIIAAGVCLEILIMTVLAQSAPTQPRAPQPDYQALAVERLALLATCLPAQSGVEKGEYVRPAVLIAFIRSDFERKHPGKTLNDNFETVDKPAAAKPPATAPPAAAAPK